MKIFLTCIYVVVCIALAAVVLMQEGKQAGLGALTGTSTYWATAKNRSQEGRIKRITYILSALFFILSLLMNIAW